MIFGNEKFSLKIDCEPREEPQCGRRISTQQHCFSVRHKPLRMIEILSKRNVHKMDHEIVKRSLVTERVRPLR